jgi:putative CocE/NonD family hydrolase
MLNMYDPSSGKNPVPEGVKNVTFYVMGDDESSAPGQYWTTVDDFPTFVPTHYYLNGDYSLSTTAPTGQESTTYVYDPANPVQTIGGNNLEIACGPLDQRPIEKQEREDVLIFTSDVLTQPLAITGPLFANLFVSSNTTDTDFVVKLIDVYPANSSNSALAGSSILVADGIVRMRWRDAPIINVPQPITPGQVYNVQVSLWNTSYIFAEGHRVRVHVTSSNWPRFKPNPNTGLPVAQTGPNVTAANTVYMSAAYPSSFIMPVVDAKMQLPPFPVAEKVDALLDSLEPMWQERLAAARGLKDSSPAAASIARVSSYREFMLDLGEKVIKTGSF